MPTPPWTLSGVYATTQGPTVCWSNAVTAALRLLSTLARGSPIPMNTRFVMCSSELQQVLRGQDLIDDFVKLKVAFQSHSPSQAESTIQHTPDLS